MAQTRKPCTSQETVLRLKLEAADPAIESYIATLKKKYKKYAMPIDKARAEIDAQMGERTLTEFLYEAREQAG